MEYEYEYDVFLSYPRQGFVLDWVVKHFLPGFQVSLNIELGHLPSIFVDQKSQGTEAGWEISLKMALLQSRCMVALWTPSYFQSRWCQMETLTILQREKAAGRNESKQPPLFYPVVLHDGDSFPSYAKESFSQDMRRFLIASPGFRQTETYLEFQESLRQLANYVAKAILAAPDWNDEWLQLPAIEVPAQPSKPFELPTLG